MSLSGNRNGRMRQASNAQRQLDLLRSRNDARMPRQAVAATPVQAQPAPQPPQPSPPQQPPKVSQPAAPQLHNPQPVTTPGVSFDIWGRTPEQRRLQAEEWARQAEDIRQVRQSMADGSWQRQVAALHGNPATARDHYASLFGPGSFGANLIR